MKQKLVRYLGLLACVAVLIFTGCEGPAIDEDIAEDPVCLYDREMSCVYVRKSETPHKHEHNGKTYYFCSKLCVEKFSKDPQRFLPKNRK